MKLDKYSSGEIARLLSTVHLRPIVVTRVSTLNSDGAKPDTDKAADILSYTCTLHKSRIGNRF